LRAIAMPLAECQFLSAGRVRPDPAWGMAPHSHPFHELIAITAGRMRATIDGQPHEAVAGQCFWYPPGVVHEEHSDPVQPVETLFIAFRWQGGDRTWSVLFNDAEGRVTALIGWIRAERDAHARHRQLIAQAFLQALVAEFERLSTAPSTPTLPERIRAHMRAHLAESLSLDDLAGCVQMSKFHFARTYRALTGLTPMEDLRRLRLEAARNLLLTTDLPLKTIAPQTGLGDEYHLSHLFRRTFGIAPGELRRHRS
jgi:AraC-like DNA-binding protein